VYATQLKSLCLQQASATHLCPQKVSSNVIGGL
jgi:hypothetical protein